MKTKKIKLKNLIPAEYNPRQISNDEMNILIKNLNEFGLVDPIIINLKNNHIIGGHQRYNALLKSAKNKNKNFTLVELGNVGWVFEDKSFKIKDTNYEKALNLSLNKISGEWEHNKLTNLFSELKDSKFNLELTGFNDMELALFDDEEQITFNMDIFNFNDNTTDESTQTNEKNKKEVKCICPKCNHEFVQKR